VETVLTYDQAVSTVRQQCALALQRQRAIERLPLGDAVGRVLAEDVLADRDQPPFDRATRDGFAARASDWIADEKLGVAGTLRAGESWQGTLGKRQAIEIMTGAPLPSGADSVVMVEHVSRDGDYVTLVPGRRIAAGNNVVRAGVESAAGAVIVSRGTRIGFRQVAVAAACGYADLPAFKRPSVAILATGDELVDIADTPLNHQIRNSNGASLSAQVSLAGGAARSAIVPDDRQAIDLAISEAMKADMILLSGGVSMGRYDFVEDVLTSRGAEFFFTGVRMQPGKPVVFGRLPTTAGGWKYFFGLPGNPVSTMVTFALFAAPLLRSLAGEPDAAPTFALAALAADLNPGRGLTRFLPGEFSGSPSATVVAPIAWQGSGDLAANARANCYIVVPADNEGLKAGQIVSVLIH
jgi:molybdopterin molybdotransferase